MSWTVTQKGSINPGYRQGFWHPSVTLFIESKESLNGSLDYFYCQLSEVTDVLSGMSEVLPDSKSLKDVVNDIFEAVFRLQTDALLPVWHKGTATFGEQSAILTIPVTPASVSATVKLVNWFISLMNESQSQNISQKYERQKIIQSDLKAIVDDLRSKAPSSTSVWAFLKTAYEMKIPYLATPSRAYQFGYGSHSRWLDSTFSDATSVISANMARNKPITIEMLRIHGLPVQPSQTIGSEKDAIQVAQAIGYPVVVKPVDMDRGYGVVAGIENEDELRTALKYCSEKSRRILIEKHFKGRDYRLTVFEARRVWAVERQPAMVVGDGKKSIKVLLDEVNSRPERSADRKSPLTIIELDNEARAMLVKQGLTESSVPAEGVEVVLRRISNVSRGGEPVAVFDNVHPDNARLAEKAARILRLDFAGIDLLIPDIAVSWKDTGAAICEVNAQPGIGTYTAMPVYRGILQRLLIKNGMIPLTLIIGEGSDALAEKLFHLYTCGGTRVSAYFKKKLSSSTDGDSVRPLTVFQAGKQIVFDHDSEAGVLAVTDDSISHSGLPFPLFTHMIITDDSENARQNLSCLIKACSGNVIASSDLAAACLESSGIPFDHKTSLDDIFEEINRLG